MLRRVGRCSIRATFSEDSTRSSWVIVNVIGQVVDKIVENTPTIEAICMAPHIVQSQFRLETSLVTYAKVGTSVSILGSLRGLEKKLGASISQYQDYLHCLPQPSMLAWI